MNNYDVEKWNAVKSKGRLNYILKYGVLLWGGLAGILSCIIISILDGGLSINPFLENLTNGTFLIYMISMMISGIIFGALAWQINCKKTSESNHIK